MPSRVTHLAMFLILSVGFSIALSQNDTPNKSALETNKKGFEDLPVNLKDWKRVAIPVKGKLAAKSPWKADKDSIECDASGVHEMLLYNKELTNGVFHVEWRMKKTEGKVGISTGLYVRTSVDGSVFHQVLLGNKTGGYFAGLSLRDGKPIKIPPSNKEAGPSRIKEAGEWNVSEITAKEKTITFWTNGYVTGDWALCDVPKGHIGLKADGWPVEFKNMKYKRIR